MLSGVKSVDVKNEIFQTSEDIFVFLLNVYVTLKSKPRPTVL